MPQHPKDDNLLPKGTKVKITFGYNKGKTAVITGYNFQFQGKAFLNYEGTVEGREGTYVLLADEIEVIK